MAGRNRRSGHGGNGSHVPPPWLSGWFDPELRDLFEDEPGLYETAHRLRASRPSVTPDPHYQSRLRTALMTEAEGRRLTRRHRVRAWFVPRPGHLAFGGAAAGAVLIAATVLTVVIGGRGQDHQQVVAYSTLSAQHAVSPGDVITVSFNQAMNQSAVVAGMHIEPATKVTTSWNGNQLVITPVHHLAGNTPYTVRFDRQNLRSASGTVAAAPLAITFGTAPTPAPVPGSAPPALALTTLGQADPGAQLSYAPDGIVVTSSAATGARAAAATAQASASPSASASPGATSPPATSSPSPPAAAGSGTVLFGSAGPTVLAPAASAAAFAPQGGAFAAAVPASGGSDIRVSLSDGSSSSTLLHVASPVVALTWSSSDRIVYATASSIGSVTLAGATGQTAAAPGGSGSITALAPGGGAAFLRTGGGGTVWDVAAGSQFGIPATNASFSGDGQSVAWGDAQSGGRILVSPISHDAPVTVSPAAAGSAPTVLALNADATAVAYVDQAQVAAPQLAVAQVPGGAVLAVGPAAQAAAFTSGGDQLALLVPGSGGLTVASAPIPGSSAGEHPSVPPAAIVALNRFVTAQVADDEPTLAELSGPGVNAAGPTVTGYSRAYLIDASVQSDGTVRATSNLIVDPSPQHPVAQVAGEQLVVALGPDGQSYIVTSLQVSALHDEASGPHVMQIQMSRTARGVVLSVSFDSDLDPATVTGAISVLSGSGRALAVTTTYDADTRTASVLLQSAAAGPYTVNIATTLNDVDGTPLAEAFSGSVDG